MMIFSMVSLSWIHSHSFHKNGLLSQKKNHGRWALILTLQNYRNYFGTLFFKGPFLYAHIHSEKLQWLFQLFSLSIVLILFPMLTELHTLWPWFLSLRCSQAVCITNWHSIVSRWVLRKESVFALLIHRISDISRNLLRT